MPKETDRLKLPLPLGNENVTRESINGIFEKIDAGVATQGDLDALREAVSKVDIPDASLTQKGKVQLSSKTDGTSETVAATEKAISDARVVAETNAKNASLPRTGGDISAPLTVSSWGSISAGTSGFFLMGHNCYIHPTNNKYYFKQTHSNMGARGIIFRLGQAGVYTFDTGPIPTVKDTEFTPTLVRMPTQTDYDALFQSVSNGKASLAAAITDKGVVASGSDTHQELASKVNLITTISPGDFPVYSTSTISNNNTTPTLVRRLTFSKAGHYRISFSMKPSITSSFYTACARIEVNGVTIYEPRTEVNSQYFYGLSVPTNGILSLYLWIGGSSSATASINSFIVGIDMSVVSN